jgi:hypothetical protein
MGTIKLTWGENPYPPGRYGDMLAVSIMMKTIKIKTLLEVLLRDASG